MPSVRGENVDREHHGQQQVEGGEVDDIPQHHVNDEDNAGEDAPLLPGPTSQSRNRSQNSTWRRSVISRFQSFQVETKPTRRWPSLIALISLCFLVILIIILGFIAPRAMREYAMEAATFEPTTLSIQNLTSRGVIARIQGDFYMDASQVKRKSVRGFGRFGTWIAREVHSGWTTVEVHASDFDNILLGSANVGPITVNVRNQERTPLDFSIEINSGDSDGIKKIANKWAAGGLKELKMVGKANVPIKSGIFSFGHQLIIQTLTFHKLGTLPAYSIDKMIFEDAGLPEDNSGLAINATLVVKNDYPVNVDVPAMAFEVYSPNCDTEMPVIPIGRVTSQMLHVSAFQDVIVDLYGLVQNLPEGFTKACPGGSSSPLDRMMEAFFRGEESKVFIKGSSAHVDDVPKWISDLVSSILLPILIPTQGFAAPTVDNLTLDNVQIDLPNPFAKDGSPESNPAVSATLNATILIPSQINTSLAVQQLKADADVFYKGSKLGKLDLKNWQSARSSQSSHESPDDLNYLQVECDIHRAPINITDDGTFDQILQALLFGEKDVMLDIKASVDVRLITAVGQVTVKGLPAEGRVPVKPIGKQANLDTFKPVVGDLQILDTSPSSLTIAALLNFTNPSEYAARIPYVDVEILKNGSILGHGTVRDIHIRPGKNINLPVTATWNPRLEGGEIGHDIAVELLSQYISGYNTTITLRAHEESIPNQPSLGRALSRFPVDIPTPLLPFPSDGENDDDGDLPKSASRFIREATMHLVSSTANFVLISPLRYTTLYITFIDAVALYKGDEAGQLHYEKVFAIPPYTPTLSPSMPVTWKLGSVGYDAIKNAVGGKLKLSTKATIGILVGDWYERIWFEGDGIGARIRL